MKTLPPFYNLFKKEQLKAHLLFQMNENIRIVWENVWLHGEVQHLESSLKACENALKYKDKVIDKYKELLRASVEDI